MPDACFGPATGTAPGAASRDGLVEGYPRQALVEMVTKDAPELATRFIGHTPALDARERPQGIIGQREDEIRHWLSLHGQENRPWLALDDCQDFYWRNCGSLCLVDWETGLVPEDVWAVVESLRG